MVLWSSDRFFLVNPLSYFSFQSVIHVKGHGMCYHLGGPLAFNWKEYMYTQRVYLSQYLCGHCPYVLYHNMKHSSPVVSTINLGIVKLSAYSNRKPNNVNSYNLGNKYTEEYELVDGSKRYLKCVECVNVILKNSSNFHHTS